MVAPICSSVQLPFIYLNLSATLVPSSRFSCRSQVSYHTFVYYFIRGHPFMTSTRRGEGSGGRMWTGEGPAPCGRPHRTLKLESTDVILSSSHAKKLASFLPEFHLWTEKSGNFSAI